MSLAASLSNITIADLNFTNNCTNLALGIDVYLNDFVYEDPNPGNLPYDNGSYYNETADSGPGGEDGDYGLFWTNGTSPEWLGFWRYALRSVLPATYENFSDKEISDWSNDTEYFYFFDYLNIEPLVLPVLAQTLAFEGGCKGNFTGNITNLVYMEQACMAQYCCSSTTNDTVTHSPKTAFPFYTNWSVEDACSFNTCQQSNQGNPDLGGIGVLVAYLLEGSLLALSIVMYGLKLITDVLRHRRGEVGRKILDPHDAALLASSGVFLDTSAFFALSICFASIIFNYQDHPLLYEDKLGQASSLLTIDAPVAIILLSYPWLERRNLRIFIAVIVALMTFIIQFLFRRARSFNPGDNLCLNWDSVVEGFFRDRFTVKAVWASLVFFFFVFKIVPWHVFRRNKTDAFAKLRPAFRVPVWLQVWRRIPMWESLTNSRPMSNFCSICVKICTSGEALAKRVYWEKLIAYTLAVYALYDSFYDIRFLIFLRKQEKLISVTKDSAENQWGYGQILAVFVWVPVIVEYLYVLGWKLGFYQQGKRGEHEDIVDDDDGGIEMDRPKRHVYEKVPPIGPSGVVARMD